MKRVLNAVTTAVIVGEYSTLPPSTVTCQPPIKLAGTQAVLGVPLTTCGTASGDTGGSPFTLPFCSYSTIQGLEKATTPAGIFKAVRVQLEISVEGVTAGETYWVAESVGTVKEVFDTDTYLMAATNILRTFPDPFWFLSRIQVLPRTLVTSNPVTVSGKQDRPPSALPAGITVSTSDHMQMLREL